jgi:hypothetical protein
MEATTQAPVRSGYIEANGVNYYFAIYGQGEPLLLLHGGLGEALRVDADGRLCGNRHGGSGSLR